MPEYGIVDKDPERIAEEQAEAQFLGDSAAAFKRAELQEIEDRRRQANAEQERLANQQRVIEELQKIAIAAQEQAVAAKEQADLAKKESELAKMEACEAKRQSRSNSWIAFAAVVVAILSWLVPKEAVYTAIYTFFQPH